MLAGLMAVIVIANVIPETAPTRYKIDIRSSQEVDMAAVGGGKQQSDLTGAAWITVTMSDTAGGQLAHIVVDSIVATPGGTIADQMTAEAIAAARGAVFHLYVVKGKVQVAPKALAQLPAQWILGQALPLLFPGAKADLKVGETWADTTSNDATTEAGSQTGATVIVWKVLSRDGDAYVMEGGASGAIAAQFNGGDTNMSTKVTGTQKVITSMTGPARSGSLESKVNATVVNSQAPDPIVVTAVTSITLTAIT